MLYNEISSNKVKSVFLFILFLIFVGIIVFIVNLLFFQGYVFIIIAALIAISFSLISYYSGDKIVLAMTKAKEAKKKDYPFLVNLVEGLVIAAGIPKPKLYVIPGTQINAFACGKDPKNASLAVTEGALQKLDRQELEGVVAHELSHIKNFDIRVMMLASVLVGIIIFISEILLRSFLWGGVRTNDNNKGGLGLILMILGVILLVLSPIIAQMIKFAISRKREFLADASGALITRNPKGLANALRKIKDDVSELKVASNSTAHLFISNPFKKKQFLAKLFSTHPDVNERIKKLESM